MASERLSRSPGESHESDSRSGDCDSLSVDESVEESCPGGQSTTVIHVAGRLSRENSFLDETVVSANSEVPSSVPSMTSIARIARLPALSTVQTTL